MWALAEMTHCIIDLVPTTPYSTHVSPESVLPAVDDLLHPLPLPRHLQGDEAGPVVVVLEPGLAAGDHVELVVGQLQGLVEPHRHGNTALLGFLKRDIPSVDYVN